MIDSEALRKMEEEERDAVLVDLINEVGWVFLHPILREWVTEAPSTKSLGDWIDRQFSDFEYRLDLIRAVRKAHKAWCKSRDRETRRNLLETPKNWRVGDMFNFNEATDFPGQHSDDKKLFFARDIKFFPDEERVISCGGWPMILREFGHLVGSTFKSSVDEYGGAEGFWSPESGLDEMAWSKSWSYAFSPPLRTNNLNDFGYDLNFKTGSRGKNTKSHGWFKILFEKTGVVSYIVQVKPEKGETYSRFYKMVQFRDNDYRSPGHSIRIIWPIDCYGKRQVGKVIFQKYFSLYESNHMKAMLELQYKFGPSFKLEFDPEHLIYDHHSVIDIRLSSIQPSLLFQKGLKNSPPAEKITEAIAELYGDFLRIWEFTTKSEVPKLNLGSILGKRVFRNPPGDLLKIFTGEDPDFRDHT